MATAFTLASQTNESFASIKAAVTSAPAEELPRLLGQAAEVEAMIRLRLATAHTPTSGAPVTDSNLGAAEAAKRLGVSKDWLYRNAKKLPFSRRIGRRIVFSATGLARWSDRQALSL